MSLKRREVGHHETPFPAEQGPRAVGIFVLIMSLVENDWDCMEIQYTTNRRVGQANKHTPLDSSCAALLRSLDDDPRGDRNCPLSPWIHLHFLPMTKRNRMAYCAMHHFIILTYIPDRPTRTGTERRRKILPTLSILLCPIEEEKCPYTTLKW